MGKRVGGSVGVGTRGFVGFMTCEMMCEILTDTLDRTLEVQ